MASDMYGDLFVRTATYLQTKVLGICNFTLIARIGHRGHQSLHTPFDGRTNDRQFIRTGRPLPTRSKHDDRVLRLSRLFVIASSFDFCAMAISH